MGSLGAIILASFLSRSLVYMPLSEDINLASFILTVVISAAVWSCHWCGCTRAVGSEEERWNRPSWLLVGRQTICWLLKDAMWCFRAGCNWTNEMFFAREPSIRLLWGHVHTAAEYRCQFCIIGLQSHSTVISESVLSVHLCCVNWTILSCA